MNPQQKKQFSSQSTPPHHHQANHGMAPSARGSNSNTNYQQRPQQQQQQQQPQQPQSQYQHRIVPVNKQKQYNTDQNNQDNRRIKRQQEYIKPVLSQDGVILLKSHGDLFSFRNPYLSSPPIIDREWVYNPAVTNNIQQDENELTYTFDEAKLTHGVPLFPQKIPKNMNNIHKNNDNNQNDNNTTITAPDTTVMCYNVLSALHVSANEYPSTPSALLHHNMRVPKVFNQIVQTRPSLLAMQEVDCPFNTYIPLLNTIGYQSTFKLRRGIHKEISGEGLVLSWQLSEWQCIAQAGIEYSSYPIESLCKEQLALTALLQSVHDPTKNICLVTTHILFNPKRINIKSAQVQMMINGVYAWLKTLELEHQIDIDNIEIKLQGSNSDSIDINTKDFINNDQHTMSDNVDNDDNNSKKKNHTRINNNDDDNNNEHQHKIEQLLDSFTIHTTDISTLFRPIIINYRNGQEHYALEYLVSPGQFYTISRLDNTTVPSIVQLHNFNEISEIRRLDDSISVFDIFTPAIIPITPQSDYNITVINHLKNDNKNKINDTNMKDVNNNDNNNVEMIQMKWNKINPIHKINSTKINIKELFKLDGRNVMKFTPLIESYQPDGIIRLEGIDWNNYEVLSRAIYIQKLSKLHHTQNTTTNTTTNQSSKNNQLALSHPNNITISKRLIQDITDTMSSALASIDQRIFMEHIVKLPQHDQKQAQMVQGPASFTDQTLFGPISEFNFNYLSISKSPHSPLQSNIPTPFGPVDTLERCSSPITRLFLHSPANGGEVSVDIASKHAKPASHHQSTTENASTNNTDNEFVTKYNRLPPQTTLCHKGRVIDQKLNSLTIQYKTQFSPGLNKVFNPQTGLLLHEYQRQRNQSVANDMNNDTSSAENEQSLYPIQSKQPYFRNIKSKKLKQLHNLFFNGNGNQDDMKSTQKKQQRQRGNSHIILTGDFNASVDSDLISFLISAEKLPVLRAIEQSSDTFTGIMLEKDARKVLREACKSSRLFLLLQPILASGMNELSQFKQTLRGDDNANKNVMNKNNNNTTKTGWGHVPNNTNNYFRYNSLSLLQSTTPSSSIHTTLGGLSQRSVNDCDVDFIRSNKSFFSYLLTHAFTSPLSKDNYNTNDSSLKGDSSDNNNIIRQREIELKKIHTNLTTRILQQMVQFHFQQLVEEIVSHHYTMLNGPARKLYVKELHKQKKIDLENSADGMHDDNDQSTKLVKEPSSPNLEEVITTFNLTLDTHKKGNKKHAFKAVSQLTMPTTPGGSNSGADNDGTMSSQQQHDPLSIISADPLKNTLYSILGPLLRTNQFPQQGYKSIITCLTQYVYSLSILEQFVGLNGDFLTNPDNSRKKHNNKTINDGKVTVNTNNNVFQYVPYVNRQDNFFTDMLKSLSQKKDDKRTNTNDHTHHNTDDIDNIDNFITTIENSFQSINNHTNIFMESLLHRNTISSHQEQEQQRQHRHTHAISHPLMARSYHFANQYTQHLTTNFVLGTSLVKHFPLVKLGGNGGDAPIVINPYDEKESFSTTATAMTQMVQPLGKFQHVYQQEFLPRAFRFSSVQERGKCVVDHMMVSDYDINTILNTNPYQLNKNSNNDTSSNHNGLVIKGILDLTDDVHVMGDDYFLPDTREGSDHLAIMTSLRWE